MADRKTNGVNKAITDLAYRGRPPSHESYADYWIGKIRRFRNSGVSVPNSEEIRKGVQSRKAYGGKASDAARTILWEINARLVRDVSPSIEVLSLEHIMPVKLSSEWRAYLGDDCEELERVYVVSVRKFTATLNTGDSRGISPHSVMYGAIQMLVGYKRFGEILHEDFVFMDAVRRFHAPIRQGVSIFVRKNTKKYLPKPPCMLSKWHMLAIF